MSISTEQPGNSATHPPIPKRAGRLVRRPVVVGLVAIGAMAPAISAGDHTMMEGLPFLLGGPQRGDVVVFKTGPALANPPGTLFVKRVAGLPGEKVQIKKGKLLINGNPVVLENKAGEINYVIMPAARFLPDEETTVTIPSGEYFVLGDVSTNSYDSRFWGLVPRSDILGRMAFCYWPPRNVGAVK